MPAARYWRIVGVETYAGGDLELSELHLYDASGRVDAAATLTSTIAPTAGTLAELQDDNLGTTCRFAGAAVRSGGFALVWDFGAGNTADVIAPRFGAAAHNAFMAGCSLQYSTDGAQWWPHFTFNRYIWPGAGAYTPAIVLDDPHIDKVALLLHMDGADGSTTFTDSSICQIRKTCQQVLIFRNLFFFRFFRYFFYWFWLFHFYFLSRWFFCFCLFFLRAT